MAMAVTPVVDMLVLMEIMRALVTSMYTAITADVDVLVQDHAPHTMAVVADEGLRDN